ncbi:unnamed protein product [Periconia digitata]|uniref:Uncharacterized protein n=1 Tax=Periconia digitata TaxID=1303443 RepID=A0A9W4XXD1_9PLEO|nr:unnamed protein product [Periconia digitata]
MMNINAHRVSMSPVSPVEASPRTSTTQHSNSRASSSHRNSSQSAASIQVVQPTAQPIVPPPEDSKTDWIPFTLRWYALLLPIITSLSLSIILASLTWYSSTNFGIGKDDGSSSILFGWRFTPTLIAVLYTQSIAILFEDLKRTEPFARLAKPPPEGASAYGTVLQTPKAWWAILADLTFRRKRLGMSSWALACSAIIYTIALLTISPLSSALLTSQEIRVPRNIEFTGLTPALGKQFSMNATRDVYFRTIAALTRNISTSAWISDTSLTLPFWPSSEQLQMGSTLSSAYGSWKAETTNLEFDFSCQEMTLERAELRNQFWVGYEYKTKLNGTTPMVSYVLTTPDKCKYELDVHPAIEIAYDGGVIWANTTSYPIAGGLINLEMAIINANVSFESPYVRLKSSNECQNREIIIASTPWTSPVNRSVNEPFMPNDTYVQSPDFRMRALLCESGLISTNRTTNIDMYPGSLSRVYRDSVNDTNGGLTPGFVDYAKFQNLSLMHHEWEQYVDNSVVYNAAKLDDMPFPVDGDFSEWGTQKQLPQRPAFLGMGMLLGPSAKWNLSTIIEDSELMQKATKVKGRFLMEILRNSLTDSQLMQTRTTSGETVVVETRVLVLKEIGIALSVLFALSFGLLIVVLWSSRLCRRPLNLPTDPGSTVGMSLLLNPRLTSMSTIRKLHGTPKEGIVSALDSHKYMTAGSTLYESSNTNASNSIIATKKSKQVDWRPRVLHLKYLFALGLFLALVVTALLILITLSSRFQLYQKAFVYEKDLSEYGLSISAFAPISIAPTLISILISLWWDQVDMTFRHLQPYISMSRESVPISSSSGLSYRSKTWFGTTIKAVRHRHWALLFISIGSILSQVLTVSMSAMFERRPYNSPNNVVLNKTLETRQLPLTTTIRIKGDSESQWSYEGYEPDRLRGILHEDVRRATMRPLFADTYNNWLYDAPMRFALNGSQISWSRDEWNFVPISLSTITAEGSNIPSTAQIAQIPTTNVTFRTTALRARLECSPVHEIANQSSWLQHLSAQAINDTIMESQYGVVPDELSAGYRVPETIFANTTSATTLLSHQRWNVSCCMNGTFADPQNAVLAYWSPMETNNQTGTDPYRLKGTNQDVPAFMTKWIVGKPRSFRDIRGYAAGPVIFEQPPKLQAARCKPVIESAEAEISTDAANEMVHSYELLGPTTVVDSAWHENYVRHDLNDPGKHFDRNYTGELNITTSMGVLFMDALLTASSLGDGQTDYESMRNQYFVYREEQKGINMDLMSYAMYTLANNDPEALLDYTTLTANANRTFQTFFQQFIHNRLSIDEGGAGYQKIAANMNDIGQAVDYDGTALPNTLYQGLNTNRTAEAVVYHRIQVLHLSELATYLAVSIIIWLMATTATVALLQRRYMSTLLRNVELIADVLVLVAGSDNFLELVQEKGVSLKKNKKIMTRLGWFKGRDGEVRWGVEVVGGRNAVEWVDAPMKRFS